MSVYCSPLDGGPQQRAAGLVDATDDGCNALQCARNGRWNGDVDMPSANAMADRGCGLVRPRLMAAGDDDTARMVRSEVGGYPPSDDAVAADDRYVPIIQASPSAGSVRDA